MNDSYRKRAKKIRNSAYLNANLVAGQFGWDQHRDFRVRSLSKLIYVLTGLHTAFCSIDQLSQESDEYWSDLKFPKREHESSKIYIASFEIFIKIGFVASLFSVAESTFRGYLQYLDINQYEKIQLKTEKVIKTLLTQKLTSNYLDRLQQVDFLRHIRNTLHTNGLFSPPDDKPFSIVYRYKEYEFIPGRRINFVNWNLLLNLADDMRSLLFKITVDEKIVTPKFIPDPAPLKTD
jgi:hypothetical protein